VSDKTRSQAKNMEDCMDKLTQVIRSAVQVPRDPDAETMQRVKQLYVSCLFQVYHFITVFNIRTGKRRRTIEERTESNNNRSKKHRGDQKVPNTRMFPA
jgi:hypothetical protein